MASNVSNVRSPAQACAASSPRRAARDIPGNAQNRCGVLAGSKSGLSGQPANGRSWRFLPVALKTASSPFLLAQRPILNVRFGSRDSPFAKSSGNVRNLRTPDGRSRREAPVADRGLGRLNWVGSGPRMGGGDRFGAGHSSGSPAFRTPSNTAGQFGICSIIDLTVNFGFRRRASANEALASSILPASA
jgi:hypothetical protein